MVGYWFMGARRCIKSFRNINPIYELVSARDEKPSMVVPRSARRPEA